MRRFVPALLLIVAACAAPVSREFTEAPASEKRAATVTAAPEIENLPDEGEAQLIADLQSAAMRGDTSTASSLVTEYVQVEAEAVHGSFADWLATLAQAEITPGLLYSRDGCGGRFLTAEARAPGGSVALGFFIVRSGFVLRVDNVLSTQPVVPGVSPALAGSRANILRAFWGYYGALRGAAPEFFPDRPAEAPQLSQRLRLAAWRSSVAPMLRERLVQAGPELARNSVPRFIDAMRELVADYNLPEIREADLKGNRAAVLFTPTEAAREARRREPFTLEYKSGWFHGMQVLVSEDLYSGRS
jgi:hypothetical protein